MRCCIDINTKIKLFFLVFIQVLSLFILVSPAASRRKEPVVRSVKYTIAENDRILFIGDSSTLQGSTSEHGFVNDFEVEVKRQFPNVNIFNGGGNYENKLIHTSVLNGQLIKHFKPTKIIMVSGNKQFVNGSQTNPVILRKETELIMAAVLGTSIPFIFCSTLPYGERVDGSNEMNIVLEEFVGMTTRVAKDFKAMHIDLFSQYYKFLEKANIDNLMSSVLTYNQTVLNPVGHKLVATVLLKVCVMFPY